MCIHQAPALPACAAHSCLLQHNPEQSCPASPPRSISIYMLELYQDTLMDLLLPPQPKGRSAHGFEVPKLEIKKDPKGLVTVMGATVVEVTSAK